MPLRLKSLELQGYKTFATRTVFEFSGGITAIVGPNGSGKSNIADAIRWVLGEQSYTLLRGKKTEDMIFSGSEHRPRSGMAQATVTFDNSDTWLPLDYTEVELSRRAYRDGRNDYLLNGHHVRLRDINEILSQAGLSERTYTILGQGLVDASLALKADERRRLFEEAAGVGLYRARREEALKRLDQTDRNLERVLDILSELEPRLRSLERQAKRSIDYARAQSELKAILREWYGYHWNRAEHDLQGARAVVKTQEAQGRDASSVYEKAQAAYTAFRERLSGLRAELNAGHRQLAELHSQHESISRDVAVLEERRRALTATRQSVLADQERAADEEKLARERLTEAQQETGRLRAEFDESQRELSAAKDALQRRQSERGALEEQLTAARAKIESQNQQKAESQARLDELKSRMEAQEQKLQHAGEAIAAAKASMRRAEQQVAEAGTKRQEAEAALREQDAKAAAAREGLERLDTERRAGLDARARQEAEHSRLRAQLEVLDQAEQSLAGYAEGARFLLDAARQSRLKGARGALSAALDVPAELETAVAAALGDTLDAVLFETRGLEEALSLLESDGAGRAALLPLDGQTNPSIKKPADEACLGVASELIRAPEDLRTAVQVMLGQTLIVRDRTSARQLSKGLPPHGRIVTLRGEVFRGDGLIIAGKTASSSPLSRPRQKRELESAAAELARQVDESNAAVERLDSELVGKQSEAGTAENEARESRVRLGEAQEAEQQAGLELESARRQLDWHNSQLAQLEGEAQQAAALQKRLEQSRVETNKSAAEAQAQVRELSNKLAEIALDELQSQAAYWATRVAVAEQGLKRGEGTREERNQESTRLDTRKSELSQRLEEAASALNGLDEEQTALREREGALNYEIEALHVKMDPAERDLETAEQEEARLQEAEAQAQRGLASAERASSQVQLDEVRRQDMLKNLQEKILDDFALVSSDFSDEAGGPAPLPFEEVVAELPAVSEIPAELEAQLTAKRARLRRMGAINPEAKEEFERESERHKFLKAQVEDLHKAQADLKQVIEELDELTKRDFLKTFEAVDKEFRQSFVRLFGGGGARLSLTEPDNVVETGIEVEARLPGRRSQGLALLSGGERSLTAIALVFALIKVSPTPLCVLDEVDAMLDEANVGRFRDLLGELSKETQFIIITHNRNTVQAADVIYGVTMGRDSTSQMISLRLDEVTEELLQQ